MSMKSNQQTKKSKKPVRSAPKMMTPEKKTYTTGLNLTALDTPPSSSNPALYHVQTLNNISAGDNQRERNGMKIQAKRLHVRVKVAVDPNSNGTFANLVADAHLFRIVVYRDAMPNGGGVSWQSIFDGVPSNSGQEYSYQVPWYKKRFQLLCDKFVRVGPSYVIVDGATYRALGNNSFVSFEIPLNQDTWYSDTTSNLTSIQQNNYGMFIASDASSTAYPTLKFSYRSLLDFFDY